MVSPTFLFPFLFLVAISTHLTSSQPDFLYQFCEPKYGNYTPNSTYQQNLNTALSSITPKSISAGGSYRGSGRVNVVGLCRGDVRPADCFSCLNDSRQQLVHQCPNSKQAVGWYDNCMLRYSNASFFGLPQTDPSIAFINSNNVTSDAARFDDVVVTLLTFLAGRAAGGGSIRKFASGNVSDPESGTVYGLAQCSPDLSAEACNGCLNATIAFYPQFFTGKIGGRVLAPSCNYRYEVSMFYNLTAADVELFLPPSPAGAPAPGPVELPPLPASEPTLAPESPNSVPPSTNSTGSQGEENKASQTVVGAVYVATLTLLSMILIFW